MSNIEGWKKESLSNQLILMRNGYAGRQVNYITEFPVSRIETISDGKIDLEKIGYVSAIPDSYLLKSGDLLFSNINSLKHIGKLARVGGEVRLFHGMNLLILRPAENVDEIFLFYLLVNQKPWFERMASQAINQASINQAILKELLLEIPRYKLEQTRIAEILLTVDKAIEQTEALIAKQQRIKAGLMQDLLTRGIDEKGNLRSETTHKFKDSPLGRIPQEWTIARFSESNLQLIDGDRGGNYPKQDEFSEDGYCLFLSTKNVTKSGFCFIEKQFISREKDHKMGSGKLKRGDIVITTRGTIGNFAYYDDAVPYENIRVNSGMIILRNLDPFLRSEFIFESMRNHVFEFEFKRTVSGSAQPQLPSCDLKSFHLIKPSLDEQNRIVNIIKKCDNCLSNIECLLIKMRYLKKALMQDLLTGKTRVIGMLNNMELSSNEDRQNITLHQTERAGVC